MPNKWIEHVKKYAKDNNLSFGCALTCPNLKKDYIPVLKLTKKEKENKTKQLIIISSVNTMIHKIKTMNEETDKPVLRMKYNSYSESIRDIIKDKYPKYYNKLFSN